MAAQREPRKPTYRQIQLQKLAMHSAYCNYEGAGEWTHSFRIIQHPKTKTLTMVSVLKCSGCGHSIDW